MDTNLEGDIFVGISINKHRDNHLNSKILIGCNCIIFIRRGTVVYIHPFQEFT